MRAHSKYRDVLSSQLDMEDEEDQVQMANSLNATTQTALSS